MLYSRDYRLLTPTEELDYQKAIKFKERRKGKFFTTKQLYKYHKMMPEAAYHLNSLFPNNFLNTSKLKDHDNLNLTGYEFAKLLNEGASERDILNFINGNQHYCLIGAILKSNFYFGHHGAYAFKEFQLPPSFVVDYLLIGKSSSGYQFVFVELENPANSIVNTDGSFGTTIRKGLKQIEDWDEWIDSNFSHLELIFEKAISPIATLPKEFRKLDKTRIHFAVVAGRRKDYTEKTYRLQRQLKKERNIILLHYDNLIDTLEVFKSSGNY